MEHEKLTIKETSYSVNVSGSKVDSLRVKQDLKTVIRVYDDGKIDIKACLQKRGKFDIPKFGLDFEMPEQYENIQYYGMGERENYSDMNAHALMGVYTMKIDDMFENYIKPQDNGNRCAVRWAKITDSEGEGIQFTGDAMSFNFNASRYDDKTLAQTAHSFELKPLDKNVIRIDGFVRGVGSNSCGPDTRAEFRHTGKEDIEYSFRMSPILK